MMGRKEGFNPQPFQEKFDTGSQGGSPLENEGQVNEVSERKKQKSKIYVPDLAQRINEQFMGVQPDNTSLSGFYKYRKGVGKVPHGAWHDFLQGLELRERLAVSGVIRSLLRAGYSDVGSVRNADVEDIYEARGVGPERATFIKEVFKAKEGASKTKEAQSANQTRHEPRQEDLYNLPFIHNPMRKPSL